MTPRELLAATGNVWEVSCFRDGNRRRFAQFVYVRSADRLRAKAAAQRISGCPVADARPWNPERDLMVSGWIRKVPDEAAESA